MKSTNTATQLQLNSTVLIALSAIFFGSYGIWSKLMIGSFGEFSQAWVRAALLLFILIPFGIVTKKFKKIQPKDWIWFLAFSLCGGLNQAPYFYGFEHLSIGTATLLFYTMLVVGVYILGKIFCHEKLTLVKYFSLGVAILGLSIIYRFSLTPSQILPALASCIAGLLGAGIVVFSKKLSSNYSETQILTSVFVAMLVVNFGVGLLVKDALPSFALAVPWMGEFAYASAMICANAALIAGFKHIEPSIGGLIGLLEVIFGVVFGILFFGELITLQLIVGGVLILAAAGLADFVSLVKKQQPHLKENLI